MNIPFYASYHWMPLEASYYWIFRRRARATRMSCCPAVTCLVGGVPWSRPRCWSPGIAGGRAPSAGGYRINSWFARGHQPEKKDKYRREGKCLCCFLGDRVGSIPCRASNFATGRVEEFFNSSTPYFCIYASSIWLQQLICYSGQQLICSKGQLSRIFCVNLLFWWKLCFV